jgi:FAD/FMN-containing dehydrogenase
MEKRIRDDIGKHYDFKLVAEWFMARTDIVKMMASLKNDLADLREAAEAHNESMMKYIDSFNDSLEHIKEHPYRIEDSLERTMKTKPDNSDLAKLNRKIKRKIDTILELFAQHKKKPGIFCMKRD